MANYTAETERIKPRYFSYLKDVKRRGERCQTAEEFKAWSQNLGHSGVLTTFTSYGTVSDERQATIIRMLGQAKPTRTEARDQLAQDWRCGMSASKSKADIDGRRSDVRK